MPAGEQIRAVFCKRCERAFKEPKYVKKHYQKAHPECSYDLDFQDDFEQHEVEKKKDQLD